MKSGLLGAVLGVAALGACHDGTPPKTPLEVRPSAVTTPAAFGPKTIDALLRAEWAKAGLSPTPLIDDAHFARRVYLDVVGTVPPPDVLAAFLADKAIDKRTKLVDQLLASPAYAAYWSTVWEDTLVGWQTKEQAVDRGALREWLEAEFAANTPWNRVVSSLLTASGRNSAGGKPEGLVAEKVMTIPVGPYEDAPGPGPVADGVPINGATNWIVKYRETPADLAGNASRLFLGVQIQCAQCHDHKTEKWKQDDFRRFAACFVRTRSEVIDKGKVMGRRRVEVVDVGRPLPRYAKNPDVAPLTRAEPTALDGTDFGNAKDVRQALAAWMTAKENPWFAKAIVNRMWGHFLGRGFVDPVDDLRPSNPPVAPQLFDLLADDFTQHGDDLKALIRTITATEAYQLAPAPRAAPSTEPASGDGASGAIAAAGPAVPSGSDDAGRLWSRFHLTPLGPNELLRALLDVTGVEAVLAKNARANLERIRLQVYKRYSFVFDVDESFDQVDFEGTVAQALTLLNGAEVGGGTAAVPGSALDAILRQPGPDADKVTALYRRAIARDPTATELAYWQHYVGEPRPAEAAPAPSTPPPPAVAKPKKNGKPAKEPAKAPGPDAFTRIELRDGAQRPDARRQAYEDLFWALLNSSEFTFNH